MADAIWIAGGVAPGSAIAWRAVRSSGPGRRNVNVNPSAALDDEWLFRTLR